MKTYLYLIACIMLLPVINTNAGMRLAPDNGHMGTGLGLVVSDLPVASADLSLPVSTVYYEWQFMDPTKMIRTSAELGIFCFYGVLPFPELSANFYLGSEEQDIQGKLGIGGFYDIAVGGHAGLMTKAGVVLANRFDITVFFVPQGKDSDKSYGEYFGLASEEEAKESFAKQNNRHVVMPYYGLMFSIRY